MHSGWRLAHPHRRHHPALGPVIRIIQQRGSSVQRCRIESPAAYHAIAHLSEKQPEVQRPATTSRSGQALHNSGQKAAAPPETSE
jgi:hypothetical protein